ncbi:MAG: signal peptidase I [Minisyncoccota bacterium]
MDQPKLQTRKESFFEFIRFVIIAALIIIPVRTFIAQPFIVEGTSMSPTFETSQYVIVDELSYRFHPPSRDDVIVVHSRSLGKDLIKRIVGLPNETISISNGVPCIAKTPSISCTPLRESFVFFPKDDSMAPRTLGPDEYFVMGDNRMASLDSRYFGPVTRDEIIGHTFLRLLPPSTFALFPGQAHTPAP